MVKAIRFENLKRPAANVPLAEIEVEGVCLDLHQKLRLVGLTFGIEPTTATLGWAAVEEMVVIRKGQAVPISGLALHCSDIVRFEVSFQEEPPGQLEYFELRQEKGAEKGSAAEVSLRFFFEGGTVRISCDACRAELVTDAEDELSDPGMLSGPTPGLVQ